MKKLLSCALIMIFNYHGIGQSLDHIWNIRDTTNGSSGLGNLPIILIDSTDNLILCGETYSPGPLIGFYTAKYTGEGNLLWRRYHDTFGQDEIKSAVTDAAGAIYVGGDSKDIFTLQNEFVVIKYSPDGDTLWQYTFTDVPGISTRIRKLLLTPQQELIIIGGFSDVNIPDSGLLMVSLDSSGNVLWQATVSEGDFGYSALDGLLLPDRIIAWGFHGSASGSKPFAWHVSLDGQTITTGESEQPYTDYFMEYYFVDGKGNLYIGDQHGEYKLYKYNAFGIFQWEYKKPEIINPNGIEARLTGIQVDNENNVYVAGVYYNDTLGIITSPVSKLTENGVPIWEDLLQFDTPGFATPSHAAWINDSLLAFVGTTKTDQVNNYYQAYLSVYTKHGPYYSALSNLEGKRNAPTKISKIDNVFYLSGTFTGITAPSPPRGYFLAKYAIETVGVPEPVDYLKLLAVRVSPNPVVDDITIRVTNEEAPCVGSIALCRPDGSLVGSIRPFFHSGENVVRYHAPLAGYPPGVYLLQVTLGRRQYSGVVVKG